MNAQLAPAVELQVPSGPTFAGSLIINADDWGRDLATTDRIRECFEAQAISSASAMVFMADSERAAKIARLGSFDCGLHLNFTTPFSASLRFRLAGTLVSRDVPFSRGITVQASSPT